MEDSNLIFEEFYEYFKSYGQKAVAVISDKQVVFRISTSENYREIGSDHMGISRIATQDMGVPSNNDFSGCNCRNAHMFFQNGFCELDLPEGSYEISISQFQFIEKILDAFEKAQNSEDKKIDHTIMLHTNKTTIEDIKAIIEDLKQRTYSHVYARKEKIIGETHNKEAIKKQMLFNLDFVHAQSLQGLINKLTDLSAIYDQDSFYHYIFCEAFPNYKLVSKLLSDSNFVKSLDFNQIFQDMSTFYDKIIYLASHHKKDKTSQHNEETEHKENTEKAFYELLSDKLTDLSNIDDNDFRYYNISYESFLNYKLVSELLMDPNIVNSLNFSLFKKMSGYDQIIRCNNKFSISA